MEDEAWEQMDDQKLKISDIGYKEKDFFETDNNIRDLLKEVNQFLTRQFERYRREDMYSINRFIVKKNTM